MAEKKNVEKEGLFDKFYSMSKELKDLAKRPIIKEQLKGRIRSAHLDARSKIADLEFAIAELKENVGKLDINELLKKNVDLRALNMVKDDVEELYLEMFAEEISE